MKINVIATGSKGNLYELLDNQGNSLLVEAGMSRPHFMKHRIGKKVPEMCIISHLHSDHAKYKNDFLAVMRVEVMTGKNDQYFVRSENWRVLAYDVQHGDTPCKAFLIKSEVENKLLFFATDLEFRSDYEFFEDLRNFKVENYLLEMNYNDYLYHIAENMERVGCDRHMSDNDVVSFMRIVKPHSPNIILIHGSERLSQDAYTRNYLAPKIPNATIRLARGVRGGVKDIFII